MKYRLSPSSLSVFKDCPRCFWLEKNRKVKRPRGIFPSLPGGIDRVVKNYMDNYRQEMELPPEVSCEKTKDLILFDDQEKINLWRNWRSGLSYTSKNGNSLIGALDDLLFDPNLNEYAPFDYKTKGSPSSQEDAEKYYTTQLDIYALMLEGNGYKVGKYGYLSYWSPLEVVEEIGYLNFHTQFIEIEISVKRAQKILNDAVTCLSKKTIPVASKDCEYCNYYANRSVTS